MKHYEIIPVGKDDSASRLKLKNQKIMNEAIIHGLRVKYENNAKEGIEYLRNDLDREEARVFFNEARRRKYAKFEDDQERQYTLFFNSDGSYSLVRRESL